MWKKDFLGRRLEESKTLENLNNQKPEGHISERQKCFTSQIFLKSEQLEVLPRNSHFFNNRRKNSIR